MTKKVRTYSDEFKAEAVKKIADNNGNVSATAKQLGIAMQTLSNWQNKANQGKLIGTEQYDPDLMSALQEIKQLKRQLKVAEEEREILKRRRRTSRETVSQVRLYQRQPVPLSHHHYVPCVKG
ncbi:hypothetical protein PKHYL_20200 [Psychrobacter sp. KH172YL61]|nr:hypothetical protein PKHYL_20200 [Psychrobacter sp. KH172YL61]